MKDYFVYILRCSNDTLYTGYTTDIIRRFQEHKKGINCKYTRSFPPVEISACWHIQSDHSTKALQFENAIKKMSKQSKIYLIQNPQKLYEIFSAFSEFELFENKSWCFP